MANKYEFMLPESAEIVADIDLRDENEYLDAVLIEQKLLTRYADLAATAEATRRLDGPGADKLIAQCATWSKPHLDRIHELTALRVRELRSASAPSAPVAPHA